MPTDLDRLELELLRPVLTAPKLKTSNRATVLTAKDQLRKGSGPPRLAVPIRRPIGDRFWITSNGLSVHLHLQKPRLHGGDLEEHSKGWIMAQPPELMERLLGVGIAKHAFDGPFSVRLERLAE